MRFFDTVVPADHYCIPPLERLDLDEVVGLVRDKRYFRDETEGGVPVTVWGM